MPKIDWTTVVIAGLMVMAGLYLNNRGHLEFLMPKPATTKTDKPG